MLKSPCNPHEPDALLKNPLREGFLSQYNGDSVSTGTFRYIYLVGALKVHPSRSPVSVNARSAL